MLQDNESIRIPKFFRIDKFEYGTLSGNQNENTHTQPYPMCKQVALSLQKSSQFPQLDSRNPHDLVMIHHNIPAPSTIMQLPHQNTIIESKQENIVPYNSFECDFTHNSERCDNYVVYDDGGETNIDEKGLTLSKFNTSIERTVCFANGFAITGFWEMMAHAASKLKHFFRKGLLGTTMIAKGFIYG